MGKLNFVFVLTSTIIICGVAQDNEDSTTILNLSGQGWKTLDSIDLTLYPNVEEIDLSNNNLEMLREDVFQNNNKLKKLNLANNKDLFLPQYATLLISDIEELNLTDCNIFELPSNIFDGLPNLKIIDLRNNPIKIMEPFTFDALQNPQLLYLPESAAYFASDICTTVEELEIIVDSKENNTLKCLNNTIYQKEPQSGKLHKMTILPHEKIESVDDSDEIGNFDVASEEMYLMDQEQNDQPAVYEGSGDEPTVSESDKAKTAEENKQTELATETSPETSSQSSETSPQDVKKETESGADDTTAATMKLNNVETVASVRKTQMILTEDTKSTQDETNSRLAAGEISEGEIKTKESSSNANIFIILGVAVVCVGLAAFGYRWYKNKTYKAANTEEPIERELKEISVHHNNGMPKQEQEQPLMQNSTGEGDNNKHNGDT